jgi:hypothetical protein
MEKEHEPRNVLVVVDALSSAVADVFGAGKHY